MVFTMTYEESGVWKWKLSRFSRLAGSDLVTTPGPVPSFEFNSISRRPLEDSGWRQEYQLVPVKELHNLIVISALLRRMGAHWGTLLIELEPYQIDHGRSHL
jgi:hypothetical protein